MDFVRKKTYVLVEDAVLLDPQESTAGPALDSPIWKPAGPYYGDSSSPRAHPLNLGPERP
jgi:hypothetical protein